jgi:ribosomal subunit interface protein
MPLVADAAHQKACKLDRLCPDITDCDVTIELAGKHRHQGHGFRVRVDVTVPGHRIVASCIHEDDAYVALREAFDDLRRQLQESPLRASVHQQPPAAKRAEER